MAGDWKNARREYEGILDQNQNNAVALNRLAFSCQHLGDYDQAIKYYMRTLNAQPSLPVRQLVYSRLAKAYMKKDQQENAIVACSVVIDAAGKLLLVGEIVIGRLEERGACDIGSQPSEFVAT